MIAQPQTDVYLAMGLVNDLQKEEVFETELAGMSSSVLEDPDFYDAANRKFHHQELYTKIIAQSGMED